MGTKIPPNWQAFKLQSTRTERISKSLVRIIAVLIVLLVVAFFGVGTYLGWLLSDRINLFLSSVIALFAFVEGLSTYIQTTLEKDKNRLNELRDELTKTYAPLYSIFSTNWTHVHEKEIIVINETDKNKIDRIIRSHPFLIEPILLEICRKEVERLKPYKSDPVPIFIVPAYFVTHITMQYDKLTDEYHKRVGMEMSKESSIIQRIHRYPPEDGEKTLNEIIALESSRDPNYKIRSEKIEHDQYPS
jgi:hypothetical protein